MADAMRPSDPFARYDMKSILNESQETAASGSAWNPMRSLDGDGESMADFDPYGRVRTTDLLSSADKYGLGDTAYVPDGAASDSTTPGVGSEIQQVIIKGKRLSAQEAEDFDKQAMRLSVQQFSGVIGKSDRKNPNPKSAPISNADFRDFKALNQREIRSIINSHNPKLIDIGIDQFVYDTSSKYEINPKVLLATLAQEQNWGLNGKVSKIAGIDGGGGGNPIDLPIGKSIDRSAEVYRKHFDAAVEDPSKMKIRINYDPRDNEQRAVFGKKLDEWQAANPAAVSDLHKGVLYTPGTASEYAKLKYTPFTYFAPQNSRPYDTWVNIYRGFK